MEGLFMVDTIIVEENGVYKIERYKGQNLDEYPYIAETMHEELLTMKVNENMPGYWYMKDITLNDIYNYMIKEFNYKF